MAIKKVDQDPGSEPAHLEEDDPEWTAIGVVVKGWGGLDVEPLDLAIGVGTNAAESSGEDACGVDDHDVWGHRAAEIWRAQDVGQIADESVFDARGVGARDDEQSRGVARLGRSGGDELIREYEIEVGGTEHWCVW